MMANLQKAVDEQTLIGKEFKNGDKIFKVAKMDNFSYKDPIDGSVTTKQVCSKESEPWH